MKDRSEERTLLGSAIRPGHCVIVNECDRPCARLIAVIDRIEGELVWCRYLSTTTSMRTCGAHVNDVTPVERFGVQVIADQVTYRVRGVKASTAKYREGSTRLWQADCAEEFLIDWPSDFVVLRDAISATTLEPSNES